MRVGVTGITTSAGWIEYGFSKKLNGAKFELIVEKTSTSHNYMCIKQLEMQITGKESNQIRF